MSRLEVQGLNGGYGLVKVLHGAFMDPPGAPSW